MKVGIIGISGRMGAALSQATLKSDALVGGVSSVTTPEEWESVVKNSDVLADFSVPEAALRAAEMARKYKIPLVSGTTNFSENNFARFREYSRDIPLLHSSNFSVCVHLMAVLLKKCEKILQDFDFSITERHNRRKKDAPSGTALFLAKQIDKPAQTVSIRSGGICGDHVCDFIGENEMLTISHRAFNRDIFAAGALNCARWLRGKNPGFYSMNDYLKEKIDCPI
ncbi:MAG: 4-hydroxy-tetrahydrodipicolinate reductase [Holosporaceae bacterium]|jgi:4-hydroxy-tetrahydrodipicolinate reductase|nr:4-hydroxy-tetrahydrodipicolinate reductase [Holosporaceae bacterium]